MRASCIINTQSKASSGMNVWAQLNKRFAWNQHHYFCSLPPTLKSCSDATQLQAWWRFGTKEDGATEGPNHGSNDSLTQIHNAAGETQRCQAPDPVLSSKGSRVKLRHFSFYPKILNSVEFKHSASLWIGPPCFSAMLLPLPPCNISISPRGSPRLIRFPPDVMYHRAGGLACWLAGGRARPTHLCAALRRVKTKADSSECPKPRSPALL